MSTILGTSCLQGFQNSPNDSSRCVPNCPTQANFELQMRNGVPACVYKSDSKIYFSLKSVSAMALSIVQQIPDYDAFLRYSNNPTWSALVGQYRTAKEDYDKESALALGKIDKDTQLAEAFRQLQAAENVRDQSPEAYQEARVRYYTLLKGDTWAQEEANRIENAEAQPKVNQFLAAYSDLNTRIDQQQRTVDVVTGVKDKILSLKDDFAMTTNVFAKQIADLKNQIQIEKRTKVEETQDIMGWIGFLLNIVLVVVLIALAIAFGRKLTTKAPAYRSSPVSS